LVGLIHANLLVDAGDRPDQALLERVLSGLHST
jgi:hypothetical protein